MEELKIIIIKGKFVDNKKIVLLPFFYLHNSHLPSLTIDGSPAKARQDLAAHGSLVQLIAA